MIADLKELRIRLETHFEIADEEAEAGEATGTLAYALLSAIDLLKIIEERNGITEEALAAWRTRGETGRPKPKPVASND